jgi:hypothetical protein
MSADRIVALLALAVNPFVRFAPMKPGRHLDGHPAAWLLPNCDKHVLSGLGLLCPGEDLPRRIRWE